MQGYWVQLRNKAGSHFDPGTAFHPAARARRQRQHLPPADSTDFPVSTAHLTQVRARVDTVYKTESDDRSALKAQIEQLRLLNTPHTSTNPNLLVHIGRRQGVKYLLLLVLRVIVLFIRIL